jgi:hypothetical protein
VVALLGLREVGNFFTLEEVMTSVNPVRKFTHHLLGMDSRIRLHAFVDDLDDEKFFFIGKQYIHIPYVFPPVEHEIAHMVEMKNKKRWTEPDLGMATFTDLDRVKPASFFAGLAREIRARAIQLHMMPEEMGNKGGTIYNILNNQITWGDYADRYSPFGRFKSYKDVETWALDMRERTYKAWSLDRIEHEWKIRLAHISNHMES